MGETVRRKLLRESPRSLTVSRPCSRPDQIYHVTVMPCYDKKLEASRQDFYNDVYSTRDVDCVITTGELELMMREKSWNLSAPVECEDTPPITNYADLPELVLHAGTSSGSYLHSLIFGVIEISHEPLDLVVRNVRTIDYQEYLLYKRGTEEIVFKGAKCYGFRNLQNVVRKVGREAGVQVGRGAAGRIAGGLRARAKKAGDGDTGCKEAEKGYDYVEVMACPGGCVNGGGQLRPPTSAEDEEGYERNWEENGVRLGAVNGDKPVALEVLQGPKWGNRDWTQRVEEAYWNFWPPPSKKWQPVNDDPNTPKFEADRLAMRILGDLCAPQQTVSNWSTSMDEEAEARRRNLFRTQYRAVQSEVTGLTVKW
jgi:Iron only hydrogenase large subunit, C-terminal domain